MSERGDKSEFSLVLRRAVIFGDEAIPQVSMLGSWATVGRQSAGLPS